MATLKVIRKRITSVKNTQKITRAMKMVAAAKLRRASMAVVSARPFGQNLKEMIQAIVARDENVSHPLLKNNEHPKKAAFLVYTSNKGLCGGFNSNLMRRLENFLKDRSGVYDILDLNIIGKKGRDFCRSRKREPKEVFLQYADSFPFIEAQKIATQIMDGFSAGDYDEYYLVYNQFKSAMTQEIQIEKLLPLTVETGQPSPGQSDTMKNLVDFIYEPSKQEVLETLLPKFVATQIYRAHLESIASELGARMTAMESATKNAKEMIGKLTLAYNRARQATITTELMDIVNGAESIK